MERKDSIRRFLREQFRDDKKEKKMEKEKENKENNANLNSNAASSVQGSSSECLKGSNTEVKSKSSAYRLFRTVSLLICLIKSFSDLF